MRTVQRLSPGFGEAQAKIRPPLPRRCEPVPRVFGHGADHAALLHSPVLPPGDRENALSWLSKAADAWRAAQSDGALASPDRREMRQVEETLTRIERR